MNKKYILSLLALVLSSCISFDVTPQPFPAWTAIPSRTPVIVTATPVILIPFTETVTALIPSVTATSSETPTTTATIVPFTYTPVQSVQVDILGCNTSVDILHGMGEVTNAYVTVKNTGTVDLVNTCSLLRAIDEDRVHPDKKVCIANLPTQHQVTLKLTVDSAYQQDTIIQVDTSSNEMLLLRVDKPSCRDIGLFGGAPTEIGVVKPINK